MGDGGVMKVVRGHGRSESALGDARLLRVC